MEEFKNIPCSCQKCVISGAVRWKSCLKEDAYHKKLEEKGLARFKPIVVDSTNFKPARPEQMAEWLKFLSSPEAVAAYERLDLEKAAAIKAWGNYKFDLLKMEKHLDGMWPEDQAAYARGPMWTAYMQFGVKQHEYLGGYNSVKKNIKTDEDYEIADEAYKTLLQHVNKHGKIIEEMPNHEHVKPAKTSTVATHVGRRAARRSANVDSAIEAGSN